MQKQTQLNQYLESGLIAIFQAENQINEGLKTMIKETSSSDLKEAFIQHQNETEEQIKRLKKIASILDIELEKSPISEKEGILEKGKEMAKSLLTIDKKTTNKVMEGLISKGKETLGYLGDSEEGVDLAIAAGAQLIEEFEIISYRALEVLAKKSGNEEVAKLLKKSLKEEEKAWESVRDYFEDNVEKIEI